MSAWVVMSIQLLNALLGVLRQLGATATFPTSHVLQDPDATRAGFLNLPVVIIQEIASYLPLSSYVALSLTSHGLRWALGDLRWSELSRNPDARLELLKLLEKDVKHLWLCPCCSSLHSEGMFHTLERQSRRRCRGFHDYWHFEFDTYIYWPHLHLVGRRYIHGGRCGLDAEELSLTKKYTLYPTQKGVTEVSFQAKVVDGEVLLKCVYIATVTIGSINYYIKICPHLYTKLGHHTRYTDPSLETLLSCRLSHLGTPQKCCISCAPRVRSCCRCMTDYDFTVMETSDGPRVFIEVWRNFGSGQHPRDPIWILATWQSIYDLELQPGSVRARYEVPASAVQSNEKLAPDIHEG